MKNMARSFRNAPRDLKSLLLTAAVVAAASGSAGGSAEAAAGGPFLSHQALYELSLLKSRGPAAINSARGRILYNFSGSACEGYTSEFRQVSELDSGEKVTLSDLRSTSWEDGAGKSYRFKIDSRMNESDSTPVDGIAEPIPGDRTISSPDPSTANDVMKSLTRWPVTVSYYDREAKAKDGEQTPVYAMSFELYENGVSRALVLDYNDFVISGAMGKFDVKDSKPCK